jgi:hypothetical protein
MFDHDLFGAINDIMRQIDKLSFEQAKTIIGKSLREDFSEMNKSCLSNST